MISPASSRVTSSAYIPAGRIAYAWPGREQGVPDLGGGLGRDPQLVAEVARVARPADVDLDARDASSRGAGSSEGRRSPRRWPPRGRPGCTGPGARARRPARRRPRSSTSRPAAFIVSQRYCGSAAVQRSSSSDDPVDRAVVDDLAVLVAPRRVDDLPDLELRRVARHDAVGEAQGVGTRDPVLVQRADVDDGGRLADRVVLDVVEVGVRGRGEVAGPLAPLHLDVQRRGPGMERGADAQRSSSIGFAREGSRRPRTARAPGSGAPADASRAPGVTATRRGSCMDVRRLQ